MSRPTSTIHSIACVALAFAFASVACSDEPRHPAESLRPTSGTRATPPAPTTPTVSPRGPMSPAVPVSTPPAPRNTHPTRPRRPFRNPYLAAETYALSHFDPAQTDAMPYAVSQGTFHADLHRSPRVDHGPINILTAASAVSGFMWAISSEGVAYVDVSEGRFQELARLAAPGVKVFPRGELMRVLGRPFASVDDIETTVHDELGLDWKRIANGVYSVVDRSNHVFYNTFAGTIVEFALRDASRPSEGIEVVKQRDFHDVIRANEQIAGLNMTYDGKLVVIGSNSVSVLTGGLESAAKTVRFGRGERITNSAAVDEANGIYVASDKKMRKLVWTGTSLSEDEADGAWVAAYDTGHQPPSVKLGTGTGSTPTLMGFDTDPDKLVVITDGADRMKLVAFWRDAIPRDARPVPGARSPRIAGQIQVTCGLPEDTRFIQSEQSVVVNGYGAFVVNNIAKESEADLLVGVIAIGPFDEPARGVERFEWSAATHAWRSVWTRADVVSTSMVPAVSIPSGMAFVNGYTHEHGWEVTGLDWTAGATIHRTIFGQDNLGNGAYAIVQFFPNGDLLFNGIAGPTRVALR